MTTEIREMRAEIERLRQAKARADGMNMADRVLVVVVYLLFIGFVVSGCAATGNVLQRPPAPQTPADAEAAAGMRRWVNVLEREGLIPIAIEVYYPDERPAVGLVVEATDPTFTKYAAPVGEDGRARLSLPTLQIARWRVSDGTRWIVVPPPQITPEKSGLGLRGVIVLPGGPPEEGPPAPTPSAYYPPWASSPDARLVWARARLGEAREVRDAAAVETWRAEVVRLTGGGR